MYRVLTGVLVTATLLAVSGVARTENSTSAEVDSLQTVTAVFDPHAMSDLFADISAQVGPSVVTITSTTTVTAPAVPFDPWGFGFGFPGMGDGQPREYTRQGLGSGVIISEDGLIVTNNHVAGDSDELQVVLPDGEEAAAKLVGTDPRSDIALIKIEVDHPLPAITMGNSDDLRVGEWVLAIGSPFALSQTVTQGIVSFLGRDGLGLADYENYIQTDAAINPGNSGGALVNLDGELVGVNTAIASRSGGYQGIGFAIPAGTVQSVVDDLLEFGEVQRGWLGISMQEVSSELAKQFDLEDTRGVLVADILPDSPAENSDLQRGDIVTLIDGGEFDSPNDFRNIIAAIDPGTETSLTVVRDGRTRRISVTIGSREEDPQVVTEDMQSEYGWQLDDLTDDIASRLGASGVSGVVVLNVAPGGRASVAGIQPGDIIQEVNRHTVKSLSEAGAYLSETVGDALLLVWRHGRTMYMVI